jgi:DNA-binding NarL/FixJ family response regulator
VSVKIVVADDHQIFRDGLRALLETRSDFEVVGEAQDGLEAVDLVSRLSPDILILDLAMPGLHGIEVARSLHESNPSTLIIVLSMHNDRRYVIEALRAGAVAYVLKEAGFSELIGVIKEVQAGHLYLSPMVSVAVIQDYIRLAEVDEGSAFALLSAREREVLQLLAEGRATKEIAGDLHLSVKTVESHRKQIMDKLEIHSVAELTKYAIREGLTPLD